MTNEQFEAHVAKHAKADLDLNYAIVALNGEAGECAEWHKKFNLRGNPTGLVQRDDLALELGDVLFYLTRAATLNGWSLGEIMQRNKTKLDARVAAKMRQVC